jgi:hypothetical protein
MLIKQKNNHKNISGRLMIKYFSILGLLILLFSCSSGDDKISSTNKPASETISKNWLGKWERQKWQNDATLEIKAIKDNTIEFSIFALCGANMGELDGYAIVEKNIATYLNIEDGDSCLIKFSLKGDSVISIDQQKGLCYTGVGVWYSGNYKNERNLPKTKAIKTLVDLEIFNSTQQDSIFKELVDDRYDLFVNSTQLTSESDDLDSLKTVVKSSGVRGLFTIMENIIMIDSLNNIWAAVIDDNKVYYFTNNEKHKNTLPKTIDNWRENFKKYDVVFK